MGLTQHVHGWLNIAMLVNLLLLRGNIGREGGGHPARARALQRAGPAHRRHRRKARAGAARQAGRMFGFEPPRDEGTHHRRGRGGHPRRLGEGLRQPRRQLRPRHPRPAPQRYGLGGPRPHRQRGDAAQPQPPVLVGKTAWLLPCLVRAEEDMQATGAQAVSMEDSLSHIHGSLGRRRPAAPTLRSEIAIVGGAGQGDARSEPEGAMGRLDGRLRPDPRPDRRHLARRLPRLQRPALHAGRLLPRQRRARAGVEAPTAAGPNSPRPRRCRPSARPRRTGR
jgi:hypothetical protein